MPRIVAVGDLVKVRAVTLQGTQVAVNVRHYRVETITGASVTDTEIAVHMEGVLAPLYKLAMCDTATWKGVGVQVIFPGVVEVEQASKVFEGPGGMLAPALPPQACGLIRYTTRIAGPGGRGFTYAPFPGASAVQGNGTISVAHKTTLENLGTAWMAGRVVGAGGNTASLQAIIYSREFSQWTAISGRIVSSYMSQQKRRSYLRPGDIEPLP